MNNVDKVFLTIKAQCAKQKNMAQINNFEIVARQAGVPVTKLESYLDQLQQRGLIKFSTEDQYIYLTVSGKNQDQLIRKNQDKFPANS